MKAPLEPISGVVKMPPSVEVAAICEAQTRRCPEAVCTLMVVLGRDGVPLRMASDGFPSQVRDDFAELLNEALARIDRGEGLQS